MEYRWGSSDNFNSLASPYSIPDYNNNNLIGNKTLTVRVTDIFSRSSQAQQTIKFIDSEEPTNDLLSTSNVQNLYNKTDSNSITVKTNIHNSMSGGATGSILIFNYKNPYDDGLFPTPTKFYHDIWTKGTPCDNVGNTLLPPSDGGIRDLLNITQWETIDEKISKNE